MEINVQDDKVLNKRLYKQSLSGTICNCTITFSNVEPGLYISNVTIIPDSSVCRCRWTPGSCGINGWCCSGDSFAVGGKSFPQVINVYSTSNVSIKVDGITCCNLYKCPYIVVDDKSVVFLKQL